MPFVAGFAVWRGLLTAPMMTVGTFWPGVGASGGSGGGGGGGGCWGGGGRGARAPRLPGFILLGSFSGAASVTLHL